MEINSWKNKCQGQFQAWPNSSFDGHFRLWRLCFFVHASLHDEEPYMILLLQICEDNTAQEFYIYSGYSQKPMTIVVKLCISDNCGGPPNSFVNILYARIKKANIFLFCSFIAYFMSLIHSDFKFEHEFYTSSCNTNELQSIKNDLHAKLQNKFTKNFFKSTKSFW